MGSGGRREQPARRPAMVVYRLIQWLLGVATRVFFRRIEIVGLGNVPRQGAVLLCGNHPNSLLDPILITAHSPRVVSFAAKDTLFENRLSGLLLRSMGAVPVRRRSDHPGGAVDNDVAFEAMIELLAGGGAVGIFPEGLSHLDSQLAPLRTGAARIALAVKRRDPTRPVYLVPTGLVYFTRHRFRSSVLIQFGAPIEVSERDLEPADRLRANGDGDGDGAEAGGGGSGAQDQAARVAARALTDRIESRLRALTINAGSWDTLWVLDGVRRLYQPEGLSLEERVELARRFNSAYPQVAHHPEVRALTARVRRYLVRLSAAGVRDGVLKRELGVRETSAVIVGHVALLLFWTPLSLLGAPIHVPLGLLFRVAGQRIAPRKDTVATAKFVLGFLTMLLVYVGLAGLVWWQLGPGSAALTLLVLPLSGWALVHVIGRADALRHTMLTLWRVLRLRREVAALRLERAQLVREVEQAVERYRPEDLEDSQAMPS